MGLSQPASDSSASAVVPFVRIIVLNFNAGPALERCVSSLIALDWPADRLEVAVIDNASTDGSLDALRGIACVRLLENSVNTGFAANNLLMTDLDGVDRIALVNPDAVVRPDWLRRLNAVLDIDPRIGAACPLIHLAGRYRSLRVEPVGPSDSAGAIIVRSSMSGDVDWHVSGDRVGRTREGGSGGWEMSVPAEIRVAESESRATIEIGNPELVARSFRLSSGRRETTVTVGAGSSINAELEMDAPPVAIVQNAGSSIGPTGIGHNRDYLVAADDERADGVCDVDAWCGAGVLLRAEYLRDVGLFDDRLFLYYEDTDLSWRGRNQGWRYRFEPSAVMEHEHSRSTGHGSALYDHHHLRNRLLVTTKNAPGGMVRAAWRQALVAAIGQAKHEIWRPLRNGRRPEVLLAGRHMRAFVDAVRLAPVFLRERRSLGAPPSGGDGRFDPRAHR